MKNDINLLSKRSITRESQGTLVKKLRIVSVSMLLCVGALSALIFFIKTHIGLAVYKQQESLLLQRLETLQEKQAKVLFLHNRLSLIALLLPRQTVISTDLDRLFETIPQDVAITSLQIDEKKIDITLTASSLLPLNTFLDTFQTIASKNDFLTGVTVHTLSLSGQNTYTLALSATIL